MKPTPHEEHLFYILNSSGLPIDDCNRLFNQIRAHINIAYTPKPIEEVKS